MPEPCAIENEERYEKYFDLLETEMRGRVKRIEELRDSVHKER